MTVARHDRPVTVRVRIATTAVRPRPPITSRNTSPNTSRSSIRPIPPAGPAAASVERGELAPVRSASSGLPFALWQGLNAEDVERLIAPLALPVRSPALQKLWLSILAADADQRRRLASWRPCAPRRSIVPVDSKRQRP